MSYFHVENLNVSYCSQGSRLLAVQDCSFSLEEGESLGIVGESGSGKSTLALAVLRLLSANSTEVTGRVVLENRELLSMERKEFDQIRWTELATVFQKSMNSFSPVYKIGRQLKNIYRVHFPKEKDEVIRDKILKVLAACNLDERVYDQYPFQLSGGMLQRVCLAMALMHRPKLLILDEFTTALDVVSQQQIIGELKNLQEKYHLTMIVISHDLSVIAKLCQKTAVMYCGYLVEYGDTSSLLSNPDHPYTKALIGAYPKLDAPKGSIQGIPGTLPDMSRLPKGCVFQDRCKYCQEKCRQELPPVETDQNGKTIRCHFWKEGNRS